MPFDPKIGRTCQMIRKDRRQAMTKNFHQLNYGNQNIGEQAFDNQNLVEQNLGEQAFENQNKGNQVRQAPQNQTEDNKSLVELALPQLEYFNLSIVRPQALVNNFELKHVMFQMLQFVGYFNRLPYKDPNMHQLNFVAICDSYKQYHVSKDAIRLRLFPFSFNGATRHCFNSLTPNSITTCEEMPRKFIIKYFPPSRIVQFKNEITSSIQLDNVSFYDKWERFNDLLRKYPVKTQKKKI